MEEIDQFEKLDQHRRHCKQKLRRFVTKVVPERAQDGVGEGQ
jgi:hypothetical protein